MLLTTLFKPHLFPGHLTSALIVRLKIVAAIVMLCFPVLASAQWYDGSWNFRKAVTLDGSLVAGSHSDFPVLISITADGNLAAGAQADGDDIVFTDSDGETLLDYEIESYSGGSLVAWVKLPSVSPNTDKTIFLYYGNAIVGSWENPGGLWGSNFNGIWHLHDDFLDSTANSNDGTNFESANVVGEKIADSQFFDKKDDYIDIGSAASVDNLFSGGGTISAWIKPRGAGEGGFGRIADKASNTSAANGWGLQFNGGNTGLRLERGFSGTRGVWTSPNGSISLNNWNHIMVTYDDSSSANNPSIYINGIQQTVIEDTTPSGSASSDAAQGLRIGNYSGATSRTFDGSIDEIRVSKTILSANWVITEYNNQNNPAPGGFIKTFGVEETSDATPPAAVSDLATGTIAENSVQLNWTAPGDDDNTGTATRYDIRYRTDGFIDASNWDSATPVSGEPVPGIAGSGETFTVTGLPENSTYYFAIKTEDEALNAAPVSNSVAATTLADSTAPGTVADLATSTVTDNSIELTWTAPGDDNNTGTATTYDIRYRTDAAITIGNWDTAIQVTGEPGPAIAGSAESFVVSGLNTGSQYYWAMKTGDEVPNWSGISNSPTATTSGADVIVPAAVTDLSSVGTPTTGSITLAWTAPGDDGDTGTASSYDLRYSTSVITNDTDFNAATQVIGEPAPQTAGNEEFFTVNQLAISTQYYFAIKTDDEVPGTGSLSNIATNTTANLPTGAIIQLHPSGSSAGDNASYSGGTAADAMDTPDDDTSYGFTPGKDPTDDFYLAIDDTATIGVINSVTVKAMLRDQGKGAANFVIGMDVNGSQDFSGALSHDNKTYTLYSGNMLTLSPDTGVAWTWAEINSLIAILDYTDKSELRVSELYVEVNYDPVDSTAPAQVTDLATGTVTDTSVLLNWTAPGDDDTSGTATAYDIRYSTADITNDTDFNNATQASGESAPLTAGSAESFIVTGLAEDTTYYFAIKAIDEVPNSSTLSNVPSALTASIDLSLNKIVDNATPAEGDNVVFTLTLSNAPFVLNATGVQVTDLLPLGYTYVSDDSASSGTTYNSGTGVWDVGTLNINTSIVLNITATVNGVEDYVNNAQVTAADQADADSTANNGILGEDDDASIGTSPIDAIAPATIADLAIGTVTGSSIGLGWTAPGDSNNSGTASSYDIRYRTDAPITIANWNSATAVASEPVPGVAGSSESMTVSGLSTGTTYYFAVRSLDEVPNWSGVSNSPNATTTGVDGSAPIAVTDLSTVGIPTAGSITLSWTAPGDDGDVGTASSYDIRYSTSNITSDADFNSATQVTGEPLPQLAGSTEFLTVSQLSLSTQYYFAIKTDDEIPNTSVLSNIATNTTAGVASGTVIQLHPSGAAVGDNVSYFGGTAVDALDTDDADFSYAFTPDKIAADDFYLEIDDTTATGNIYSVTVKVMLRDKGKGASNFTIGMDVNGTQNFSAALSHDDNAYALYSGDTLTLSPDTGLSWTWAEINNLKAIIDYTDKSEMRVSELYVEIDYDPVDITAPAQITSLTTGTVTDTSVLLNWVAPGDDGNSGTAIAYDIRYFTSPINDANWASATQASGEPAPAAVGISESFVVTGLLADTTYYFAIKAIDEAPNSGALSNVPNGTTSAPPQEPASVSFQTASSSTVDESAASHSVTLVLNLSSGSTPFDITLDVTDAGGGGGSSGIDYTAVGINTITFPAGSVDGATQTVNLDVLADTDVEINETVNLQLGNFAGPGEAGFQATHTVTITDDDQATIAFQNPTSDSTDESAANHSIAVVLNVLSGATPADITVDVSDAGGGSATSATDYTAVGVGTVTFPAGSVNGDTQLFDLAVLADTEVEGDETVNLQLGNLAGTGAVLGAGTTHTATIIDDDQLTVAFQAATSNTVDESAANHSVTVVLNLAGGTTPTDVTVDVSDAGGGSATSATDYTAVVPTTLTFPAGSADGTTRTFNLPVLADTDVELDETVNLQLTNVTGTGGNLGAQNTHTATITDDDQATVDFQAATSSTADETAGNHSVTLVLSVPSGGTPTDITVDVTDAGGGSAISATDYTAVGTATVTFPAGSINGAIQTFDLAVLADLIAEGPESVNLQLGNAGGTGAVPGAQSSHTVSIRDDDNVTISFQNTASTSADESTGVHSITVVLTVEAGPTAIDVSADVSDLLTGSATSGVDYTVVAPTTITFPAGSNDGDTQTFDLALIGDLVVDGDETVDLLLSNPVGPAFIGTQSNHEATLVDDDLAPISFQAASSSTGNENTANHGVTLVLSVVSGTTPADIIVNVTDAGGGSAGSGFDYMAVGTTVVTFPAGSANGATQTFDLGVLDDSLVEGNETVNLRLDIAAGPGSLGAQTTHTASIIDDDAATVAFQLASDFSADESAANHSVSVVLSVPAGTIPADITVDVSDAGGGSATSATDYTAVGTSTITFPAGSSNGATQIFDLAVLADTDVEGNETVNLQLGNVAGIGGVLGAQVTHTATITDDDQATVAFMLAADSTPDESAANHSVTVVLNIPSASTPTDITVDVSDAGGGSATSNIDYSAVVATTLTFPAGSINGATQTFDLSVLADTDVELDETVNLLLSNIAGTGVALGAQTTHIATIVDDDQAILNFEEDIEASVDESASSHVESVVLTLLSGATPEDITVDITDLGTGSATSGIDFVAVGIMTLTFPAGSVNGATQSFNLDVLADNLVEGDETIVIQLGNVTGAGGVLGAQTVYTEIITDDDQATVDFLMSTSSTADESAANHSVDVVLNVPFGTTPTDITVDVSDVGSGSATSATDYTALAPTTLTFPAGSVNGATQTINFAVLADLLTEGDETVNLQLGNVTGTGAALGAQANHTATITDDDNATLNFQLASSATLDESAANHSVNVVLSLSGGSTPTDITVDVSDATGGSATSATDYSSIAITTLTFPAGSANGSIQTFDLAVLADTEVEDDETIELDLSSVTGTAATLGAQTTHTVTITDDEQVSVAFQTASSNTVDESAANHSITLVLSVPSGSTPSSISVDVTDAGGGSATSATDYTAVGTSTVTFPAGSVNGATQTFDLGVLTDVLGEGPESVNLQIGNPAGTGAALGLQTTHTASITDDDSVLISFQNTNSSSADETAANHSITVVLSGATGVNVSADITDALTGSATSATDYTAVGTTTITFLAGASDGDTQTFDLAVLADLIVEGDQTVDLQLGNPVGPVAVGTQSTHEATITDDDLASVAFQNPLSNTGNENAANHSVTLELTVPAGTTPVDITVDVTDAGGGSATSATDYTAVGTTTITFPAGSATGAVQTFDLAVLADTDVELSETVNLQLDNVTGPGTLGGQITHTATIIDDDAVTVDFQAANSTSIDESSADHAVTVVLTVPSGTTPVDITVDVTDAGGGSATSTTDYTAVGTTTLTFPAGSSNGATQIFDLGILTDAEVEGSETVNLQIGNVTGTGGALGAQVLHTATITDDDQATIAFQTASSNSVDESAANHSVTVVLSIPGGSTPIDITVDITDAGGGTATSTTDYTAVGTTTLTFPAGSVNGAVQIFDLGILADTDVEGDEVVNLQLGNIAGTGGVLGAQAAHTANITDDDQVLVAFQIPASNTGNENAANHSVSVVLTVPSGTTPTDITVDVTDIGGGSATTSIDYTAVGTSTLTFPAGSVNGATQIFNLAVLSDISLEGDETVNLQLGNVVGTGTALGGQTTHTATIIDDDQAVVAYQIASSNTLDESAANHNVSVVLNIPGGVTPVDVTVDVTDAGGGTATSTTDYTAVGTTTLTFPAGSVSGSIQTFNLGVLADNDVEGIETVNLQLGNVTGTGAAPGAQLTHSVNIADDDGASIAFQDPSSSTIDESAANHSVTVVLSIPGGTTPTDVTVDVTDAGGGSATSATDYSAVGTGTLTFPAGSANGATQTFNLGVLADTDVEGSESVNLQLGNVTGTGSVLGGQTTHIVMITDDDSVTVDFQPPVSNTGDESTANHSVTVVLTVPSGTTPTDVTVDVSDAGGGTATSAADYTSVLTTTLTFPAGSINGASQTFDLSVLTDADVEGNETVNLQLSNVTGTGGALGAQTSHVVTIVDDDQVTVAFQNAATNTIDESAANHSVTVLLSVPSGATPTDITVDVTDAGGGTAISAVDYTAVGTTTLTFPAGSINGATQTFNLAVLADSDVESGETVNLSLNNVTGVGVGLGGQTSHVVTITDDDQVTVAFQIPTSNSADESAANHAVSAILNVPAGTTPTDISVDVTDAGGGTATSATDYTAVGTVTLTFPAGSANGATQTFNLGVLADNIIEGDETVNLLLNNLTGTGVVLGAQTTHAVTITDDDFVAATTVVGEVSPNLVLLSSAANAFTYDLLPTIAGTDTGVDRAVINVPAGYNNIIVTAVQVDGLGVAFVDNSAGNTIQVDLAAKVIATAQISVLFSADAPPTSGSTDFTAAIDDSTTGFAAQAASVGDADGDAADNNSQSVLVEGFAVSSAVAEVAPGFVAVNSTTNAFTYSILPTINLGAGDTGLDQVIINVAAGYNNIAVTDVQVSGVPVAFTDNSAANTIQVDLAAKLTTNSVVTVLFTADAPAAGGSADFTGSVDDSTTGLVAQAVVAGDADGNAGNANNITVTAQGLAVTSVLAEISPSTVTVNSTTNNMIIDVLPTINAGDTGVNFIDATLPAGFSNLVITDVQVNAVSVGYTDIVVANNMQVNLTVPVVTSERISILFASDAPAALGSAALLVNVDDTTTTGANAQATVAGNADADAVDSNTLTLQVATATDAGASSVTVSPQILLADGVTTSTVSLLLRDSGGVPKAGRNVNLSTERGGVPSATETIVQPGVTDVNGLATGLVSSSTVGAVTIKGVDTGDGVTLTMQPEVYFTQGEVLSLSVAANKSSVTTGDIITYSVVVRNTTNQDVVTARLLNDIPPNFKYVPGSWRLNGVAAADPAGQSILDYDLGTVTAINDINANGQADPGEPGYVALGYQLMVGSGATPGEYLNRVGVVDACALCFISNREDSPVTVTLDSLFDLGTIIGRVFHDVNGNKKQDEGEEGIKGAMVALDNGTYAITDKHGRYHFPTIKPGQRAVKINLQGLIPVADVTTNETVIVSVTPGLLVKANFGITYLSEKERIGQDAIYGHSLQGEQHNGAINIVGNLTNISLLVNGKLTDVSSPDVRMSVQELDDVVVLEGNSLASPIEFNPRLPRKDKIISWFMNIYDSQEELVKSLSGTDMPPGSIVWDGKDEDGVLVKSQEVYDYQIHVYYEDGTRTSSSRHNFGVNRQSSIAIDLLSDAFRAGSSELTNKSESILQKAAQTLRAFPDEKIVVTGHTDSQGAVKHNIALSKRRAKAAINYFIDVEEIPEKRFIARGHGSAEPVADNSTPQGRAMNRRVEIRGKASKVDAAKLHNYYKTRPSVRINKALVAVDSFGRFSRKLDGDLDSLSVELLSKHGRSFKGEINLPSVSIAAPLSRVVVADTNTSGYVPDSNEDDEPGESTPHLVEYVMRGTTEADNTLQIDGESVVINADGSFDVLLELNEGSNELPITVTNASGYSRFSKFTVVVSDTDERGERIIAVDPVPNLILQLPPKGKPLISESLTIEGSTDHGNTVVINGKAVNVAADGNFVHVVNLPKGKSAINAIVTDRNGYTGKIEREVEISDNRFFLLAFADGAFGQLQGKGNLAGAGMTEAQEFYSEGRVAYYLRGTIDGKYLIRSAYDSGHGDGGDLFKDINQQEKEQLLKNIDPDKAYPVYGDDSTLVHDAQSQGKFFLAIDSDDLNAMIGNFSLNLNDTELATYKRTLYGARAKYQSLSKSKYGKADTQVVVFGADVEQIHIRDELKATGGSLYYLSHKDIVEGSEQITLIVRDSESGLILSRSVQKQNIDYSIKYEQGRLLFVKPVSGIANNGSLINSGLLAGHPVYLQVDYESQVDQFENTTRGTYVRQQIGDHIAIGGSYVTDDTSADSYALQGIDLEAQIGKGTRITAEFAESAGSDSTTFVSEDGGLSFVEITPNGLDQGRAWKTAVEVDLKDWTNGTLDLKMAAWLKEVEQGFQSAGNASLQNTRKTGVRAALALSGKDAIALNMDNSQQLDNSVIPTSGDIESTTVDLQWRHKEENWTFISEYQNRQSTTSAAVTQSTSLGAAGVEWNVTKNLVTSIKHQSTLDGPVNDQTRLGMGYKVNEFVDVSTEVMEGSNGQSAEVTASSKIGKGRVYITERQSEHNSQHSVTTIVGADSKVGDKSRVYTEYQRENLTAGPRYTSLLGLENHWDISKGWKINMFNEYSAIDSETAGAGRYSVALGVAYRGDSGVQLSTKQEYRKEWGNKVLVQFLTTNRVSVKLSEDYTVLGKINFSKTSDGDDSLVSRFEEKSFGVAYRPVRHDMFNALARYTVLSDFDSTNSLAGDISSTQTEVVSVEWSWQVTDWLEWSEKQAFKRKLESVTGYAGTETHSSLSIHRFSVPVWKQIKLAVEYRQLQQKEANDHREGWLAELGWRMNKHVQLGAGYNFTDFSDNEFSNNDYSVRGVFMRLQAVY